MAGPFCERNHARACLTVQYVLLQPLLSRVIFGLVQFGPSVEVVCHREASHAETPTCRAFHMLRLLVALSCIAPICSASPALHQLCTNCFMVSHVSFPSIEACLFVAVRTHTEPTLILSCVPCSCISNVGKGVWCVALAPRPAHGHNEQMCG